MSVSLKIIQNNHFKNVRIATISLVLVCLVSTGLLADTIILKNGDRIQGTVLSQRGGSIRIRTALGTITIPGAKIRRILLSRRLKKKKDQKIVNLYLKDGRFLRGILLGRQGGRFRIRTLKRTRTIVEKRVLRFDYKNEVFFGLGRAPWPILPPLWRSTLLPGWGQMHMKKTTKGWVLLGSTAALGLTTLILHLNYLDARQTYLDRLNNWGYDQALYDRTHNLGTWNQVFFYATLSVWVYNILDAMIFRERTGGGIGLSMHPLPADRGLALGIRIRF